MELMNAITDNPAIRQGLFPAPGKNASTQDGGGRKKMAFCWDLAVIVFPEQAARISPKATAAEKKPLSMRIKNRLRQYVSYVAQVGIRLTEHV